MPSATEYRPVFDWIVWGVIHAVLVAAITIVGFSVYGSKLGVWVGASAFIAAMTSMYLFAKIVPGETLMKVVLGLAVAANAGYLAYNGAKSIGIETFNSAQVKKFEVGMAQAAQSGSRQIARTLGSSAKEASQIARLFDDGVAVVAGILAFLELSLAIMFFAIASKRVAHIEKNEPAKNGNWVPHEFEPNGVDVPKN